MELNNRLCVHYLNFNFSDNFLCERDPKVCVDLPYPISKPFIGTKIDLISKFHDDVEHYTKQLSAAMSEFQSVKGNIMNQTFTDSHVTITKRLLHLCNVEKHKTKFCWDYNPYYANGILEHLELYNHNYLILPDYKSDLYVTNVVYPRKRHKMLLDNEITDCITGISAMNNIENLLLIQTNNQINLIKMTDIGGVSKMRCIKNFHHRVLDSKFDKTRVAVVLLNTKCRLYDIRTSKKLDLNTHSDTTIRCEFLGGDNLLLLDPKNVNILDLRSSDQIKFQPKTNDCNHLCSAKILDNLIYVSSRHHLIRTDARFLKNIEYCTHLMKSSPCYMDFAQNCLCLSSQQFEERVMFAGRPVSSLPIYVPSVSETLVKCKLQKHLLQDGLLERLQKSVGGVKMLLVNNGLHLYTANSVGDLFVQKIRSSVEEDKDDNNRAIDSLFNWLNKLSEPSKSLYVTTVENLSDVRFALDRRLQTEHLKKFIRETNKAENFLKRYKSIYSRNNLSELAANFASIWDDDEEEEEEEEEEETDEEQQDVNLMPEENPFEKVTKWIESSCFH